MCSQRKDDSDTGESTWVPACQSIAAARAVWEELSLYKSSKGESPKHQPYRQHTEHISGYVFIIHLCAMKIYPGMNEMLQAANLMDANVSLTFEDTRGAS